MAEKSDRLFRYNPPITPESMYKHDLWVYKRKLAEKEKEIEKLTRRVEKLERVLDEVGINRKKFGV